MGAWGQISIFSFQASEPLPAVEGGMGMYQTRDYYERAAAFGEYNDPIKFPKESPIRAYAGTGFGQKYRMHPFAAALGRQQLPGLASPRCRPDQKRVYYSGNLLMVDFKQLGCTRATLVKALTAEGVRASFWDYPEQHKLKIYAAAKWWHHPPKIPEAMPGNAHVKANHLFLPLLYGATDEVVGQYAQAFEKVWTRRSQLANA